MMTKVKKQKNKNKNKKIKAVARGDRRTCLPVGREIFARC